MTETRSKAAAQFTRLAGRLELSDGATLTWSVADGARGRRWRAVAVLDGAITHAVLLELDRAGRPSRLELTTPAGMVTLHPSSDRNELHGNIVTATGEGVRHLAFPWGPEHELEIAGRPGPTIAALHRRRTSLVVGGHVEVDVVAVGPDLGVSTGRRRYERLGERRWRVGEAGSAGGAEFEIDPDGLPVGGVRWALEVD